MKAILLVRVSTITQDYTAQREDLIKYSKQLGFDSIHVIEDKESAIKLSEEERNGLNAMKDFIKSHPDYNSVIVWEISRLARSEKVLHSIKDYFLQNHIQLYIYDKKYKLFNDDGSENQETNLLFSLYAYFAESEMKLKKERFKRAKKQNAQLGKYNGSKIKFGYKLNDKKYVVPDEADSKIVKQIFEMYATGKYSIPEVTKEFNLRGVDLSVHYITEMLSNTCYIGYTNYNDSRRSHRNYIPIISEELYKKVQEVKIANAIVHSKSKRYYFANKIIKCPICGGSYIFNGGVYTCLNNTMYKTCDNKTSIDSKWCDILLWYIALQNHKVFLSSDLDKQINNIFKEITTLDKKIIHTQNQVNQMTKKFDRANMLFVNLKINEEQYNHLVSDVNKEIYAKKFEIAQYDKERANKDIILQNLSESNLNKIVSDDITLKEMKDIVTTYIYKIYIYKEKRNNKIADRLEIYYKKMKSNGSYSQIVDTYYFYPYCKKARFEYNDEIIDSKIYDLCGNTLDAIRNDKRR